MLTQPGPSLTDLALGLLTLALLPTVRRPGVNRYWRATVWCAAHRRARRRGPPRVHRALGTMGRSVVGPRQRGRRRHHLVHPGGHGRRSADAPTGPRVRRGARREPRQLRRAGGHRPLRGHHDPGLRVGDDGGGGHPVDRRAAAWRSPGAQHGDRLRRQRRCRRDARRAGGCHPCGRTRPGLALPPRPDAGDGDALPRSAPPCRDGLDEEWLGPPHRQRFGRRSGRSTSQPSPGDAPAATAAPSRLSRRRWPWRA